MKPNYRAAASAGLLVTAACANLAPAAVTIQTVVVGPQATSGSFDVLFSAVGSVSDLISISDGSVYTGEGASFKISAILANDEVIQIFANSAGGPFDTIPLSSLTGNAFTDFATPQSVKGLRFEASGGNPSYPGTFSLPGSTVLTFAVPEPAAAVMMVLGSISLATHRRRKLG